MVQQFETFPEVPLSAPMETSPASSIEVTQASESDMPSALNEELESVANRVRNRLGNMTANIVEIGRELRAVKQRLEHGQFINWVEAACKLSARTGSTIRTYSRWRRRSILPRRRCVWPNGLTMRLVSSGRTWRSA